MPQTYCTLAHATISTTGGAELRSFWQDGQMLERHETAGLASGTYLVQARFANGSVATRMLVVVN